MSLSLHLLSKVIWQYLEEKNGNDNNDKSILSKSVALADVQLDWSWNCVAEVLGGCLQVKGDEKPAKGEMVVPGVPYRISMGSVALVTYPCPMLCPTSLHLLRHRQFLLTHEVSRRQPKVHPNIAII